MGGFLVRLGFVGYILVLAVLALGRFSPPVHSALSAAGLRSAVGILGYLFAGLIVAYVILWRKSTQIQRGWVELPESQLLEQQDVTALEPTQATGLEPIADDEPERP